MTEYWNGKRFKNGYLLKIMKIENLDLNISTTNEEIDKFNQKNSNFDDGDNDDEDIFVSLPYGKTEFL